MPPPNFLWRIHKKYFQEGSCGRYAITDGFRRDQKCKVKKLRKFRGQNFKILVTAKFGIFSFHDIWNRFGNGNN